MKFKANIFLKVLFVCFFTNILNSSNAEEKVNFSYIKSLASKLSKEKYTPNEFKIPDEIRQKDYSKIQQVNCNQNTALWKKDDFPYYVSFTPMLSFYNRVVNINKIENGISKVIPFDKTNFVYGASGIDPDSLPKHYTGFKIFSSKTNKELLVFQGASYFRPLPPSASYGLSLRAISINTVLGDKKEEFPDFTDFWLVKPEKGSNILKLYALLNSDSIVGAYEFLFECKEKTLIINVNSTITLKKEVEQIGFAPITSLFWFDKNTGSYFERFQPGDHNSDGLILYGDGIYTWQPLVNYLGKAVIDSYNHFNKLNFFGLLQRERTFEATVDWINKNWCNPNAWIELKNNKGPGNVRLVTTPTNWEYTDNVNTFWIPDTKPEVGKPYDFNYTIYSSLEDPNEEVLRVDNYWHGKSNRAVDNKTEFVVSYKRNDSILKKEDENKVIPVLNINGPAKITKKRKFFYNIKSNSWLFDFFVKTKDNNPLSTPIIVTCYLTLDGKRISETWCFLWYPILSVDIKYL